MEPETISKNGASPKSLMSRKNRMQRILLLFTVFCIGMASAFAQDIITLKNGTDVQALVQEVGDVDVKYKKFDNPNGPNYTMKKADIFMIRYANGSKDVFATDNTPAVIPAPASEQSSVQHQGKTQTESISIQNRKICNSDGVQMSNFEVQNTMKNVPEALDLYNSGSNLRIAGGIFGGGALVCLIVGAFQDGGLIQSIKGYDSNMKHNYTALYCCYGGTLVLLASAIICNNSGAKKIVKSVDVYNREIRQKHTRDVSLNFGITQSGGIGLALNF